MTGHARCTGLTTEPAAPRRGAGLPGRTSPRSPS
jgi:hypothetical protein